MREPSEDDSPSSETARRSLPWRVIHNLDDETYPCSRAAASYLDSVWDLPIVALSAVAPRTLSRLPQLQALGSARARLSDLRERISTAAARSANEPGFSAAEIASTALPSEALSPANATAMRSPAAATALSAAAAVIKRALGSKLAFIADVPELLPLSLICLLAARDSPLLLRLRERMADAHERLQSLAERFETRGADAFAASSPNPKPASSLSVRFDGDVNDADDDPPLNTRAKSSASRARSQSPRLRGY
jgi:hypothetical protein